MGGAIWRDPTSANGGIVDDVKAPIGPVGDRLIPPEDDSGTIHLMHRRSLIVALTKAIDDPPAAGDLALGRLAAKLLLRVFALTEHDAT